MYEDDKEKKLQKKQAEKFKAEQLEVDAACRALLATATGRKYLWWLLRIGKVGTQPFANNALNTSFNCGELNVGQQILDHIISVDPAGYVRMMQEQADNDRSSNADTNSGSDSTDDG